MIRQSAYYPTPEGYVFEVQCDFCRGRGGEVFFSPTQNPTDAERWPALPAVWMHGYCWKDIKARRQRRRAGQVQP